MTTAAPVESGEQAKQPAAEVVSDAGGETETWTEPRPLTIRQQKQFLRLLSLGASPARACEALFISPQDVLLTVEADGRLRSGLEQVHHSLTGNIRSALYREAVKGNVTALTYWLREDAALRGGEDRDRVRRSPAELIADLERIFKVLKADGLGEAGP